MRRFLIGISGLFCAVLVTSVSASTAEHSVDALSDGEKDTVVQRQWFDGLWVDSLILERADEAEESDGELELDWTLNAEARGTHDRDDQDSLVRLRLRFAAGPKMVDIVLFDEDQYSADVPMVFGSPAEKTELKGRLKLTREEIEALRAFEEAGQQLSIQLHIRRMRVKDLAVLPSSVSGVTGGLFRDVRNLEQEKGRLEGLVEELRRRQAAAPPKGDDAPKVVERLIVIQPTEEKKAEGEETKLPTAGQFFEGYFGKDEGWKKNSKFLIATLPDPIDSRFAREFDLMLGSIEKGIIELDGGFVQHSHYLPWSHPEAVKQGWHRHQPGAVIFQGDEGKYVVLLVVGEVPGAGVHLEAMGEALHLIPGREVSILGPTFSGSSRSLAKRLHESDSERTRIRLISGSATSHENPSIFEKGVSGEKGGGDESEAGRIVFDAIPYDDRETACLILGFLNDDLGIKPEEILIFAESSFYGKFFGEKDNALQCEKRIEEDPEASPPLNIAVVGQERLWNLERASSWQRKDPDRDSNKEADGVESLSMPSKPVSFPAQIARMRVASNKRRAELASTEDEETRDASPRPSEVAGVGKNLFGATIRAQAPTLTSRTEELLLANLLQRRADTRPKAVWIVATDPRDKLFLAEMLRQYIPGAILLTQESDYLLAHPDYREAARGMLVVSTIPPSEGGGTKLAERHANDWALGSYRAAQELLKPGFVPEFDPHQGSNIAARIGWVLLILTILGEAFVVQLLISKWPQRRLFLSGSALTERARLAYLVLLPSMVLCFVALVISPSLVGGTGNTAHGLATGAAAFLLFGAVGALFLFFFRFLVEPPVGYLKSGQWPRIDPSGVKDWLASMALFLLLIVPPAAFYMNSSKNPLLTEDWLQRWLTINSGVSPLIPLVLLAAIPAAWIILKIWRLYEVEWADDSHDRESPSRALVESFYGSWNLWAGGAFVFVLSIAYLATFYSNFDRLSWRELNWLLSTVEGKRTDVLISILLGLALALVLATALRTHGGWRSLRKFHERFLPSVASPVNGKESSPRWFEPYFGALDDARRRGEWRNFRERQERLDAAIEGLEGCTIDPCREILDVLKTRQSVEPPGTDLEETLSPENGGQEWSESHPPSLEKRFWARQKFTDILHRAGKVLDDHSANVSWLQPDTSEQGASIEPLRELLAVELGLYVTRIAFHLRLLLTFVTAGSVALLVAIASYPFEPRSVLIFLGTLGVIAGAVFCARILVRMERDPVLIWLAGPSKETGTWRDRSFFGRMLFHEGLPLFSVLATQVPAIPSTLFQWVQPLLKIVSP